jgi:hypothetical protein
MCCAIPPLCVPLHCEVRSVTLLVVRLLLLPKHFKFATVFKKHTGEANILTL